MPPDDPAGGSQGGQGDKAGQGDGDAAAAAKVAADAAAKKAADDAKKGEPGDQFVTPTILKGVLDANKRTSTEELQKLKTDITAQIDGIKEAIAGGQGGGEGKKKASKGDDDQSQKLIELQRTVDTLTGKLKDSEDRADTESTRRQSSEFKTAVIRELVAAGCEKPEEAFLVIQPSLQRDDKTGRVFSVVKGEYGDEDLDLKVYIEREFREKVLPHVFKGKMRAGSPAGGDAGGGGGAYEFTKEQAFDPALYTKDPEKYRAAIEQGRVKGIPKPGAAVK